MQRDKGILLGTQCLQEPLPIASDAGVPIRRNESQVKTIRRPTNLIGSALTRAPCMNEPG